MSLLCKLARKYGTDKIHYTPFYSVLLESRRYNTHRVLEIGIGTPAAMKHVPGYKPGASLRMWEEYFPHAEIYGMDIDASVCFNSGRIYTHQVDQSNAAQIEYRIKMLGAFDLIVDDGSHKESDQLLTAVTLLPYLARGGIYIVEDVNGSSDFLPKPHLDVFVKADLTGHCVVINA